MKTHKIVALSDVEHVRLKPGMYVGQVSPQERLTWVLEDVFFQTNMSYRSVCYSSALVKLFDEVISNSIDEAYRIKPKPGEFVIKVCINQTESSFSISVEDNGRGIPLTPTEYDGVLMADLALCHLRAGSNFEEDRDVSIGTHGLGVTLVNILSTNFNARIFDGRQQYDLSCSKGKVISRSVVDCPTAKTGTYVSFEPDPSMFDTRCTQEGLSVIRRRIYDLAACFPYIVFRLDGAIVQSRNFVRYVSAIKSSSALQILESERLVFQYENLKIGIVGSDEPAAISFVNGIETYEGGSHLDYVRNKICDLLAAKLSKKHKIEVKPGDVKAKLLFAVMLDGVVNPSFRSQTKEYLSSPVSAFTNLISDFSPEDCVKKILANSAITTSIVEAFILKKEAKDRAEAKRIGQKIKKLQVAKLVPANSPNPKERILFLTEGDSAIGQLSSVRDPHIHGGFPLRGKVINAYGRTLSETFENNEVAQIAATLGIRPGDEPDVDDIEYGRVVILSDADHDGSSIAAQLVNLFWKLWPKLVKGGVLWWLKPPIYKTKIEGVSRYFYSEAEAIESGIDRSKLVYLKGLGSMNKEDYRTMIDSPRWSKIEVTDTSDKDITLAFGPDSDPRKVWLSNSEV